MSAPIRLSGRRRHAYSPVPMKLQPTAGPKTAQTASGSWWSLASTRAITPAPAARAASTMAPIRPTVMPGTLARLPVGRFARTALRYAAFTRAGKGAQRSWRTFSPSARRSEAKAMAPPMSGSQKRITR